MTALAIFTRFWFPGVPMWLCALGYAVLGLGVIWIGNKAFDRLETLLACIKVAAIIMFLIIAAAAWLGWLRGGSRPALPANWHDFYPTGAKGVWASLIFAFYTFGGIEVMGLMALRLRKPNEAPRAGKVMILLLSVIYILSIGMVVMMMSWHQFSADRSPFVAVLDSYHLPFVPHVFNAVLIVAGFSTMVASLYAVTTMLVTLSEDHDAPRIFAITKRERKVPIYALSLTAGGLCISIVLSLLIPGKIYEYLTTAAGLMLLYNWLFILLSAGRMIKFTTWGQFKRFTAMLLIILAVSGTAVQRSSRPGMFISLGFLLAIGLIVLMMNALWKKNDRKRSSRLPQHNE
ncbi:amino acid permease [Paenibacillus sp. JCM 10914]|nr:amino acid permease [Paenibacillus sp. JCM 10914]